MRESVFELLARLEVLLQRGAAVPLTDKKVVDEREVLGMLEMIRAVLPTELREAQAQAEEAERVLRAAQNDARRIVLDIARQNGSAASRAPDPHRTGSSDQLR